MQNTTTPPQPPPVQQAQPAQANPTPSAPEPKKKSKAMGVLLAVVAVIVFAVGGVFAYKTLVKSPKEVLMESFNNLTEADSFNMAYTTPESEFLVDLDYIKDRSKFSSLMLKVDKIDESVDGPLSLTMIANEDDFYGTMNVSFLEQIEADMGPEGAMITGLVTYQMVRPILTGESWTHFSLKEMKELQTPEGDMTSDETKTNDVTDAQSKKMEELWGDAFVFRKFKRNEVVDGVKYTHITIGFDKKNLITAIDYLKDLDIKAEVGDINKMITLVQSSDDWDNDLIDILIDKDGRLAQIQLRFPKISEEKIEAAIQEGVDDGSGMFGVAIMQGVADKVAEIGNKGADLQELGVIKFSNYDQVESAVVPTSVIEMKDIIEVGQQELMPLIGGMMVDAGGGAMPSGAAGYPTMPEDGYGDAPNMPVEYKMPAGY